MFCDAWAEGEEGIAVTLAEEGEMGRVEEKFTGRVV